MLKRTNREWPLAWLCLGLTALLAVLILFNANVVQQFDNLSFELVARLDGPVMTTLMKIVTQVASPAITLLIAVVFGGVLYFCHQRTLGLLAIITLLGGDAAALVVKYLVRRARPTQQLLADTGYSFPSGHVFGTTLLMVILLAIGLPFIASHRLRFGLSVTAIIWILIVALSRVYLRDHFASDTLGSVTLTGFCWQQSRALFWSWRPRAHALLNRLSDQSSD